MKSFPFAFSFVLLMAVLIALFGAVGGCDCGDAEEGGSDSSGPAGDDTPAADDDDDSDDDDDDFDDDDSDDDDDVVTGWEDYPQDPGIWIGDFFAQQIDGGMPGRNGLALSIDDNDMRYIVAEKGRIIYFYTCDTNQSCTRETLYHFASQPDMVLDDQGVAHVCFTDDLDTYDNMLVYATNATGFWRTTVVDFADDVGNQCSIALDPDQNPQIAYLYQNMYGDHMKYTRFDGAGWWTEDVLPQYELGCGTDLAIDAQGFSHIGTSMCGGSIANVLVYVTNKSGDWTENILASPAGTNTIVIDDDGFIHIAYGVSYTGNESFLKYTNNKLGFFIHQPVDMNGESGWRPTLALDENGHATIGSMYGNMVSTMQLSMATNRSGVWEKWLMPGDGGEGSWASGAVDSQGQFHVAHHDMHNGRLVMNTIYGEEDKRLVVDVGPAAGTPVIALDSNDSSRIIYMSYSDITFLNHAAIDVNGKWEIESLDGNGNDLIGGYVVVDAMGFSHTSFYQVTDDGYSELYYANNQTGSFESELFYESEYGAQSMVALDSLGNPYVLISEMYFGVMLAQKSGSNWNVEMLDPDGAYARAIKVDSNDSIHILYGLLGRDDLMYITNKSRTWEEDNIYTGRLSTSDMDLDSNGFAHVIFKDFDVEQTYYSNNINGSWPTTDLGMYSRQSLSVEVDETDFNHMIAGRNYISDLSGEFLSGQLPMGLAYSFGLTSHDTVKAVCIDGQALWHVTFPQGYAGVE